MLSVHSCPPLRWRRKNLRVVKTGTGGLGGKKKRQAREAEERGPVKEKDIGQGEELEDSEARSPQPACGDRRWEDRLLQPA